MCKRESPENEANMKAPKNLKEFAEYQVREISQELNYLSHAKQMKEQGDPSFLLDYMNKRTEPPELEQRRYNPGRIYESQKLPLNYRL